VRDQRLLNLRLEPKAAQPAGVTLALAEKAAAAARALRMEWLGV